MMAAVSLLADLVANQRIRLFLSLNKGGASNATVNPDDA